MALLHSQLSIQDVRKKRAAIFKKDGKKNMNELKQDKFISYTVV